MTRNVRKRAEGPSPTPEEDRRVQKTRKALHDAMISLVLERGYEATTIRDVVARANVGRSTFYAHYPSKEDLLTAEIADLRQRLLAAQRTALGAEGGAARRCLGFSRALFDHAEAYRPVYRALVVERGVSIIVVRMRALFADLVRGELAELLPPAARGDVPRSALVQFVVGSLMSSLTWWLESGRDVTPAEADAIFRRLTVPAIEAAAGEAR